jgi:hypothetical protein
LDQVHVRDVPEIDKSVGTKNISNIVAVAKFNISSVQLRQGYPDFVAAAEMTAVEDDRIRSWQHKNVVENCEPVTTPKATIPTVKENATAPSPQREQLSGDLRAAE